MYNALIIDDKLNLNEKLKKYYNLTNENYDLIFSFSNENIKEKYPYCMLTIFLKDINFEQSIGISLALKSNLTIIMKDDSFTLHDPLGCIWYIGNNLNKCLEIMKERLNFLQKITRQKTISISNKNLALNWYFGRFKVNMIESNNNIEIESEKVFLDLLKEYSVKFADLMHAPINIQKSPRLYRCCKGMPSIRKNNYIIVSAREVENEFIEQTDLVAVYKQNNEIYYSGNKKPSVDTPIHLMLYDKLPNINYIIHNHNYIKNAPFTKNSIPCGAIEEADEVINTIENSYNSFDLNQYIINEIGHGSIILGSTIKDLKNINFIRRPNPEIIKEV